MASFVLLFLLALTGRAVGQTNDSTEPMCHDWGESSEAAVLVLDGEAGWVSCPLFSHPAVYNYTMAQSAGHDLVWYRLLDGHDLEQPIPYSARVSRERERLWLQPAVANDTGQYICMLRNKSSCSRIAVRLQVLQRDQAVRSAGCPQVAMAATEELIGFQQGKTLTCPNLEDASKMADSDPTVNWTYMNQAMSRCDPYPFWDNHREQVGTRLRIYTMLIPYEGLYICTVRYQRRGGSLSFTRSIKVSGIYPTTLSKDPTILHPTNGKVFPVRTSSDVHLTCRGLLPFIIDKPEREIWWTVDGKRVEQLNDGRFSQTNSTIDDHRDLKAETILNIRDVQSEDLQRNFTCSVRNARGSMARWVQLEEEVSLPSVELGCGLGVTLVLMLLLFVVYHVFWLELLLLYRSWFGTDERHTDDKEFDVYISYARNSEEEQFVLSTLRSVLENELGYSVCIFDRDSLPGGTITDETLSFVARSRRLLVVVSPGYASQGSQALLELKAGIDSMALGGHLRVILVQYRPVQRQSLVRELRRARVALALVRWQGDKSKELTSRFWKQLRVELPVRRAGREEQQGSSKEAALMRLISQNSTNSQTGLISNTTKTPQKVPNSAA
ncbi:PREDICTED: interleukin-1 receptor accessory protein [Poecilia mexicana]|uniref:Interleukin 1 receptor accessory protein n=2 Tax=Poecilia TaxID=8080 RepID=A0A087XUX7_POEFO|nr:PREDICTED: interleukin-1 receptor accessory protein [Poecilia formosa]XP_014868607.1 PREDICTED: interleukin-1 receptor accessory protein [Poecilia mexicana]